MAGPGTTDRALRAACRLAVDVAREGERAEPPVPAPAALRPVLGFSRLSAAAYAVIGRVIDDDGTFRARVAERAEEHEVGRAGWLWLHRPMDWADDPVFARAEDVAEPDASGTDPRAAERDRTAKLRRQVADLQAERKRQASEIAELRKAAADAHDALASTEATRASLQEERNAAMRATKAAEAELAATRHDLRIAREATRQAEAELAAHRAAAPEPGHRPSDGPQAKDEAAAGAAVDAAAGAAVDAAAPVASRVPLPEVAASVSAAAQAAAELADALASVAALVDVEQRADQGSAATTSDHDGGLRTGAPSRQRRGRGSAGGRSARPARRRAELPPGIFDGTDEAVRHLVSTAGNLVVVDGYNLARAAWNGLAPQEERRRTVALLDDLQARSGGTVVAVFDGDASVVSPVASKHVRVRYSDVGQTADALIAELVAAVPASQPVVVISSDREVVADAERSGAAPVRSEQLLRVCGR